MPRKPKCIIIRPRWKLIRELRDRGDYDLIQYLVSMYREKSKNKPLSNRHKGLHMSRKPKYTVNNLL